MTITTRNLHAIQISILSYSQENSKTIVDLKEGREKKFFCALMNPNSLVNAEFSILSLGRHSICQSNWSKEVNILPPEKETY